MNHNCKTFIYGCTMLITSLVTGCSKSELPPAEEVSAAAALYAKACKACHASGINGAPILGNKKMWNPRIKQGIPTLVKHASNGFGLMPAKGGQTQLTEAEITAVVNYMIEQVK